jgi:restriction system protein
MSEEDQAARIPSGQKTRLDNRVQWATSYLFQAGLVDRPRRGTIQVTARGRELLVDPPSVITPEYLLRYPEYQEFKARNRKPAAGESGVEDVGAAGDSQGSPQESVEAAVTEATADLQSTVLRRVIAERPEFLEHLVLKLLNAMGYGAEPGDIEHRGGPGDAGIDGVIRQDPLGLDRVYVQAKRYTDQAVGRQEIQAFVGALHGVQADRGVFITTSSFTSGARQYVDRIPNRIILIDGQRLAGLMVRYDVGVQAEQTFTLKRIDEDFFE